MGATITARQLEIIEAAGKILTTSGVSGLTIKNLAREMKFSESAIYRHFASKEDIIVALLTYLAETMQERLSAVLNKNYTPEENFIALFRSQFAFFQEYPHFVVAVFSDGLMEEHKRINDAILQIMQVKMMQLLPVLKAGQASGDFTTAISTDELLHIVLATFRLQMFKWRLSGFAFNLTETGNKLLKALLILIRNNESRSLT